MYDIGFCVKVVKCEEYLRQPCSQQLFRKAMRRIPVQEILETILHGFLDKASMISTLSGDGEHVESCPDVTVTWMRSIAIAQDVVHIVFILVHSFSCEDLQGRISMATG
jgi:hypothetical protein